MKIVCKMFLILAGLALFAVSLQKLGDQQSEPTRGHSCAGALVSGRKVVTTAVCLHNYSTRYPELINQNQFIVFAGSNLLNNDSSVDFVRYIESVTVHPNFTGLPALVNNIGVITLVTELPITVVTPLALPAATLDPAEFKQCTVAGWGSVNKSSGISLELRYTRKYVYNQYLCTLIHNTAPGKNILPSMICAVSYSLRTSNCLGDFGNPLICGNTFAGVLSSSDNCTVSTVAEVYTRISNYTSWIRSVAGAPSLINPGILALLLLSFITSLF